MLEISDRWRRTAAALCRCLWRLQLTGGRTGFELQQGSPVMKQHTHVRPHRCAAQRKYGKCERQKETLCGILRQYKLAKCQEAGSAAELGACFGAGETVQERATDVPFQPIPASASFVTAAPATFQLDGVVIYPSGTSWRALCLHQWPKMERSDRRACMNVMTMPCARTFV